jgi:tripartite-type tricarboxylate transporter receptor subunit TctC
MSAAPRHAAPRHAASGSRRGLLRATLPGLALLAAPRLRAQESWPTRPIRLIVPFATGGTTDVVARLIAARLGETLGQSVIVDNRGGANSVIGTDLGAKAAPDGYTLTITNGAAITTGPILQSRMPYRPLEDFVHVFLIGGFTNMLVVRADHPARTLQEFVAVARRDPGSLTWGSAGVGSAGFLAGELLQQLAGISLVHVPYKGTGPAMTDLLGGSLGAMLTSPAVAAGHVTAGRLRALAVSGERRLPEFPDVPTMNETVPGAVGDAWFGVSVPARTPAPVVERLRAGLARVLAQPELRARLQEAGMTPAGLGPAEFDRFLRAEIAKWTPVIRNARITAD